MGPLTDASTTSQRIREDNSVTNVANVNNVYGIPI